MADFSRQVASARRSIAAKGRPVTFLKLPTGVADPEDPLSGPATNPVSVAGVPAVFVPPSSASALGMGASAAELFKSCTAIAMVATVDGHDFYNFDFVTDFDNKDWKIHHVEKLQPAEQTILYFIGLKRP